MNFPAFAKECHSNIFEENDECRLAREYLIDDRGLLESLIRKFCIGYCKTSQKVPGEDTWESDKRDKRIGLENKNMKGRIIVPVRAEFGGIVAFLARSPVPEEKGWWNTKFDKHNNMFLFDVARKDIYQNDKVYLVEGPMDALVLRQEGLLNVCCMMGVGLGYRRIGLIKRYCNNVCLCFDSDANQSGQNARDRSIYELSDFDFGKISTINLPIGEDPDEYVLRNCLGEFLELETVLSKKEIKAARERYIHRTTSSKHK